MCDSNDYGMRGYLRAVVGLWVSVLVIAGCIGTNNTIMGGKVAVESATENANVTKANSASWVKDKWGKLGYDPYNISAVDTAGWKYIHQNSLEARGKLHGSIKLCFPRITYSGELLDSDITVNSSSFF